MTSVELQQIENQLKILERQTSTLREFAERVRRLMVEYSKSKVVTINGPTNIMPTSVTLEPRG